MPKTIKPIEHLKLVALSLEIDLAKLWKWLKRGGLK